MSASAQSNVVILLLAAGFSSRMRGRDKLLEPVSGQPLIAERATTALASGADTLIIALPPQVENPARWQALDGVAAKLIEVETSGKGMAESLKAGIAALPETASGVLILLADMPEITSDDLRALLGAFNGEHILRGTAEDGTPGHPVLFPRRDFPALSQLSGDQGARDVLKAEYDRVRLIKLPASHALTDLDTPEDWARWRKERGA
jgi:molybdenum cofactor cytidylyltransferase